MDVRLTESEDVDAVVASWNRHARAILDAIGWKDQTSTAHPMRSGVALAISAPADALYAAVEVADWIYVNVKRDTASIDEDLEPDENIDSAVVEPDDLPAALDRLGNLISEERNPALANLLVRAATQGVTVLCDDDDVSIGLGRYSTTWPIDQLPESIDASAANDIPIGLVTGTNGKTTTVRLTQRMLRAAGLSVGLSSTDWIGVDDTIIDRGDYSGPGGARAVLRQSIDVAVLETARGGLLRRGLGMPRADAALITNIAEDHLGDFGSENLEELLNLKWIVTQALDDNSVAILNADDALLAANSTSLDVPICWFSLDKNNPLILENIASKRPAVTVIDGHFSRFDGTTWHTLCAVNDAPITVRGSARHNIANALGAMALAHSLGADDDAIRSGLLTMKPNDNPGRCNFFTVDGVDVLLDFAHNPSAMQAIFDIARDHPAKHRLLCFGQAGDRTDRSIRELGELAWAIGLDHVFISELADYRRGREPNEVFELLSDGLISAGATRENISHYDTERESLNYALEMANSGDLIIMLALAESSAILKWLEHADTDI